MTDVDDHIERAVQAQRQITVYHAYSLRQAADLRAKAEVADELSEEQVEELDSIPDTPERMREGARQLDNVASRISTLEA